MHLKSGFDETPALAAEVTAKQCELGGASIESALEAILRDAATAWKALEPLGTVGGAGHTYPDRAFLRFATDGFFDKLILAIEERDAATATLDALLRYAGVKRRQLPAPELTRRLRVVTATLPCLIQPIKSRGYGSRPYSLWQLLWLDACGVTATKIATEIRPRFDPIKYRQDAFDFFLPRPTDEKVEEARLDHEKEFPLVKRDRIWKLRKALYENLAARLAPAIKEIDAAMAA
jgi:hypothetical protein